MSARTYSPSQTTLAPEIPLHLMGWDGWDGITRLKTRHMSGVMAPRIPLHNLGAVGAGSQIVGAAAPIAGKVASSLLTTFTAAGSWAGPIGAGVAVLVGVIAGLWAAHDARAKGAKTENAAVASAVTVVDAALHAIFDAANNGGITAQQAIDQLQTLQQDYWSRVASYASGPGRADNSGGGRNCGTYIPGVTAACSPGKKCDKSCTAGCCVGCNDIWPTILYAIKIFQSGGGTLNTCEVFGDKYGLVDRPSYTLTYTPPPAAAAGVAGAVSSIESALTGGSGGSMLPLLLAGLAAWLVLK